MLQYKACKSFSIARLLTQDRAAQIQCTQSACGGRTNDVKRKTLWKQIINGSTFFSNVFHDFVESFYSTL